MSACKFPKSALAAWLDDEIGREADTAREHLKGCRECAALVDEWRRAGAALAAIIDEGVGEVDPLMALEKIHARIAAAEEIPLIDRLRRGWAELWLLHRRAFAGVTVAAALGALSAPFAVYFFGRVEVADNNPVRVASVVEPRDATTTAAPVELDVKIIRAHNRGKELDAKLQALAPELAKRGSTGYTLEDEAVLGLELGSVGRLQLAGAAWLVVKPLVRDADGKLELELSIDELKFETTVAIAPGATLVVGGPAYEGGELLVAVSRAKE